MTKLWILFFTLATWSGFCQDKVHLMNGEVLQVKVIEVSDKYITYQYYIHGEGNGALIKIRTETVTLIEFENGNREDLSKYKIEIADKKKYFLFELNPLDLMLRAYSANFEFYPTKKRNFSLLFPVRIGFPTDDKNYYDKLKLEFGAGLMHYYYRGHILNCFTGFEGNYRIEEKAQTTYQGPTIYTQRYYGVWYYTNGMRVNLTRLLGMSYALSIGAEFNKNGMNELAAKATISFFLRF